MLYRRDKPFHPGRLLLLLGNGDASSVPRLLGLSRSKGIFWLATRSEVVGEWQHAGSLYRFVQGSAWELLPGVRRQELVLIGPGLDTARMAQHLDECLLTEDEMANKKHPRYSMRNKREHKRSKHNDAHGHGHGHEHDHGHDSEGACIDENDDSAPYNWWRQQLEDEFPPFEMDCCTPGQHCSDDGSTSVLEIAASKPLRTRGQKASAAQAELSDATARGDTKRMIGLLDAGLAKVNGTTVVQDHTSDEEDEPDEEDWTSLHVGARMGQKSALNLLLDRGANPNQTEGGKKGGTTPLMAAILGSDGSSDIVELLLRRGASTSLVGPGGATALHFCCLRGLGKCALVIIKAGCPTHATDDDGQTAVQVARTMEHKSVAAQVQAAVKLNDKAEAKKRKRSK